MSGKLGKKHSRDGGRKGRLFDCHVTFRSAWGHFDEMRYYCFLREIDIGQFLREALLQWLVKHRNMMQKGMTVEQEARLSAIGGWPTREEQDRRVAEFKGKNSKRPFNEWLWSKKIKSVPEPKGDFDKEPNEGN